MTGPVLSIVWSIRLTCEMLLSCKVNVSDVAEDLRVPGYVKGYVRRFWQARYVLK